MKVIFMGGKLLGPLCLKEIVKHNNFNIELVIVNSDDRGKDVSWYPSTLKIAKKLGLRTIKFKNINNPVFIKKIKKISPDVIFCIFFEQIIKEEILKILDQPFYYLKKGILHYIFGVLLIPAYT